MNKKNSSKKFLGEGGLRKKGHFKTTLPGKPLISIITVVLNSQEHIEQTILSVINQTYDNTEFIVIDGGSTDGTVGIINKYEPYIDYWISSPDKGIYYAMNDGIELARGEWINFMNSADEFVSNDIIERIFVDRCYDADVIYGKTEIRYSNFKRIKIVRDFKEFWKGMPFCHQSSFCKASILQNRHFDTSYKSSADFNFFYNAYILRKNFFYYDGVVSSIASLGLTDRARTLAIKENWRSVRVLNYCLRVNLYYIFRIITSALKGAVKGILGNRITSKIRKFKYAH